MKKQFWLSKWWWLQLKSGSQGFILACLLHLNPTCPVWICFVLYLSVTCPFCFLTLPDWQTDGNRTKSGEIRWCPFSILLKFGIYVLCPLMFHVWTTMDKNCFVRFHPFRQSGMVWQGLKGEPSADRCPTSNGAMWPTVRWCLLSHEHFQ